MEKLDKKIKDLKKFIEEKTDLGTANYLSKEIREICGMVESEQLKLCGVGVRSEQLKTFSCIDFVSGKKQCKEQCDWCRG